MRILVTSPLPTSISHVPRLRKPHEGTPSGAAKLGSYHCTLDSKSMLSYQSSAPNTLAYFSHSVAGLLGPAQCSNEMNSTLPSLRAASLMPSSPLVPTLVRLCARGGVAWSAFLSAGLLFSVHSADASGASLFADFVNTMDPSDYLTTSIWSLASETWNQRSVLNHLCGAMSQQMLFGFDSLSLTPCGALLRGLSVRCAPIPGSCA